MAVNQFSFSFVGHRFQKPETIHWDYHLITEIEVHDDHALVVLQHDVTSAPIQVICPKADFPWLAPFLELYQGWAADPDLVDQPLLPVIVRNHRFVLSRAGAHHDYPETPQVKAPSTQALLSHPRLNLIWTTRKRRATPRTSFILELIRKATFGLG